MRFSTRLVQVLVHFLALNALVQGIPTSIEGHTGEAVDGGLNETSKLPVHYAVVVFPAFQALDVFGALDIFNTLAINYTMHLSIISETLNPVFSSDKLPVEPGDFGESILPTHTFAHPPEKIDVLLVPGGVGSFAEGSTLDPHLEFVKKTYPNLQYLLGVCTGAGLVARTGILDGLPATGNKKDWAWVTAQSDKVHWVSHARWVHTKNIWTTSGISAGLDGTYDFVRTVYGNDTGTELANTLEYSPILDWKDDKFADLYNLTDSGY